MPRPMILVSHFSEERLSRLRFLCMKLGILVKPIPPEDLCQPLGALCGLADRVETVPAEEPSAELLIFCHMEDALVNRFLTTARQMRFAPVAHKAVLTPTNAAWTPAQLYAELRAERDAILHRGAPAHES